MDCMMPIKDGFEATIEIKQLFINQSEICPKIVALTAMENEDFKDQCLKSGMDEYLTKPVSTKRLMQLIRD